MSVDKVEAFVFFSSFRFTHFSVVEVQPEKLKNLFEEWTLGHVYEMHVETIMRR